MLFPGPLNPAHAFPLPEIPPPQADSCFPRGLVQALPPPQGRLLIHLVGQRASRSFLYLYHRHTLMASVLTGCVHDGPRVWQRLSKYLLNQLLRIFHFQKCMLILTSPSQADVLLPSLTET